MSEVLSLRARIGIVSTVATLMVSGLMAANEVLSKSNRSNFDQAPSRIVQPSELEEQISDDFSDEPEFSEEISQQEEPMNQSESLEILAKNSPKKIPVYSDAKVPPYHCARYVRLAGNELFGETYDATDAWKLRNVEKIVAKFGDNWEKDIISLEKSGKLKPGMAIGLYNPASRYNKPGRLYTHVALYVGQDENDQPQFAEKLGKKTYANTTLKDIRNRNMRIVEVLDSK